MFYWSVRLMNVNKISDNLLAYQLIDFVRWMHKVTKLKNGFNSDLYQHGNDADKDDQCFQSGDLE